MEDAPERTSAMLAGGWPILEHRVDDFGGTAALAALIVVGRHAWHHARAAGGIRSGWTTAERSPRRRESWQPAAHPAIYAAEPIRPHGITRCWPELRVASTNGASHAPPWGAAAG